MRIVIELSDEIYKDIKEENGIYGINNGLNARITGKVVGAIQSGTPLPKGHGRLIDADKLKEEAVDMSHYVSDPCDGVWVEDIDDAPTIIEAESENKMLVCPTYGLDVHSDFKTCPRCGAKMIEPQESFLKKCLEGTAKLSELGDYVERWHDENNGDMSLREFLGLTEAEYSAWGKNGDDIFEEFLTARKAERESKI